MQLLRAGPHPQAQLCYSHMEKVLRAMSASLTLGHTLQAHCYVTDHTHIPAVRKVWHDKIQDSHEQVSNISRVCVPLLTFLLICSPNAVVLMSDETHLSFERIVHWCWIIFINKILHGCGFGLTWIWTNTFINMFVGVYQVQELRRKYNFQYLHPSSASSPRLWTCYTCSFAHLSGLILSCRLNKH